jgi:hypothetical protein
MPTLKPGNPVIAFFQEVVAGDIRKFNLESNDSPTGGGARDLRISPVADYWDQLLSFFPLTVSAREQRGKIYSGNSVVEIKLMAPTASRSNECRICKISQINIWEISQQDFDTVVAQGHKWMYLLILDDQGNVWASKFSSDKLNQMHAKVSNAIAPLLTINQTVRGFITF